MGCCEHSNEQLGLKNEWNFSTSERNISFLRKITLHVISQLLTAATISLSTHSQLYYRIMNSNHSIISTNTTQCPPYTLCRYSERLLHCSFCSVFCQFHQKKLHCDSKQCCCVSELAKIGGAYEEYRLVRAMSQLYDTVLLVAAFCTIVTEYSTAITRTFVTNSVIVVAISHK